MMLRKYSFPSVALHSMMKQVSDGQIWATDASGASPSQAFVQVLWITMSLTQTFLFTAATICSFSKVQVQHL